jgi:hypothetical protein
LCLQLCLQFLVCRQLRLIDTPLAAAPRHAGALTDWSAGTLVLHPVRKVLGPASCILWAGRRRINQKTSG